MASMEQNRFQEASKNGQAWYRWGSYLSERQWGTVREDYSPRGKAWDFLLHDQACSHAYQNDANFRDYIPFHEYFHGESGRGVGASHQTGWTAVVANLLQTLLPSPT